MELVDFFILLMWTLKDKLVRISKPKMKAEVETIGAFFGRNKEEAVEIAKKAVAKKEGHKKVAVKYSSVRCRKKSAS